MLSVAGGKVAEWPQVVVAVAGVSDNIEEQGDKLVAGYDVVERVMLFIIDEV
jgi:hypothetical protein